MNKISFRVAAWVLAMWLCAGHVSASSPYISQVYEFCPAPGQFVNKLPSWHVGDTPADVLGRVAAGLVANERVMVSLGGFGGYVVFGFDHMIPNVPGEYDFRVLGNSFLSDARQDAGRPGGSAEPGVVMVSYDANANGLPDDEWYELAGSEYAKPATIHDYRITYYRPSADHVARPDADAGLTDATHIRWRDNQGHEGYIPQNVFNTQDYYPGWVAADSVSFSGTRMAGNAVNESGASGSYYILYCFDYGYADNYPNNDMRGSLKIDWAVDADGQHVDLPGIHFVKVYTGLNQLAGALGETSTEVMGAEDLHYSAGVADRQSVADLSVLGMQDDGRLRLVAGRPQKISIMAADGRHVLSCSLQTGLNTIGFSAPAGIYLILASGGTIRFVSR